MAGFGGNFGGGRGFGGGGFGGGGVDIEDLLGGLFGRGMGGRGGMGGMGGRGPGRGFNEPRDASNLKAELKIDFYTSVRGGQQR